ncbi:MAG: class I adenylate-forming enzyme family protein [Pseudolabrys sp.]|nr:class I adenylate-forming enzyme family protein [Pseudolabrys sp.]
MILDSKALLDGDVTTLDDLFRRAGVRHPAALALIDPPNRSQFAGGAPRRLSFSEADRAISALAARLRTLGLSTDTQVAIQLPNTVESVIAMLGVLRAGMVPVLLPLLWRRQEMVAALSRVGVKAIITCARTGAAAQAEVAMQVAADLFPVRFVCGFGDGLPDGMVPLDDVFRSARADLAQAPRRVGNPATHTAVVTFDMAAGGPVAVMRHHRDLITAGRTIVSEGSLAPDGSLLSTIPVSSFAGLSLALLPWLLTGGALSLHHGFEPTAFAQQSRGQKAIIVPGPMLGSLTAAGLLGDATVLALWRAPEPLAASPPWQGTGNLVDVEAFNDTAMTASLRGPDGLPAPPDAGWPPRGGMVAVGGYAFVQEEIDATVAKANPQAIIVALPDALLGQRYAGSAPENAAVRAELDARGVNPLVTEAFRTRMPVNAAQSTVPVDALLRAAG